MKAFVTGGTGLVGSQIVRALIETNHQVRALVRPGSDRSSLDSLPVEFWTGDIRNSASIKGAMSECDIVFHAAAIFDYGQSLSNLEETAVQGASNVLTEAKASRVSRVVLTSTSAIFGHSTTPTVVRDSLGTLEESNAYILSKLEQERAALQRSKELNIDLILVYPTVTVGPFDSRLGPSNAIVITYLKDPFRMTYRGGINIVASADVGIGHVLAAQSGNPGRRYIIGSENLEWEQIHRTISELAGTRGPLIMANHSACLISANIEELLARFEHRQPLVTRSQAKMVGRYYWYQTDELSKLGFVAKSARDALADSIAWLAAGRHVSREMRSQMRLAPEVYERRKIISRREAVLRSQTWRPSKV